MTAYQKLFDIGSLTYQLSLHELGIMASVSILAVLFLASPAATPPVDQEHSFDTLQAKSLQAQIGEKMLLADPLCSREPLLSGFYVSDYSSTCSLPIGSVTNHFKTENFVSNSFGLDLGRCSYTNQWTAIFE